jgi:hypothetical protein
MLATHFHNCTYVGHTFLQLCVCWPHISTAVRMLVIHFYSCTYVGHTFLQLYVFWPQISTVVCMFATHFHSCTYVGHKFLQLCVYRPQISTAVCMLATHFYSCTYVSHIFPVLHMLATYCHSCTYVGQTIRETSSKTTSELYPSSNMNDVRVSAATLCLFTLHNNSSQCKSKEWRFLLLKMASKEQ